MPQSISDLSPPVLLDGAVGTELIRLGWDRKTSLERWAYEHPEITLKLHRDYVAAGAQVIYTATHGANWTRLSRYNEQAWVKALNEKLASLALTAARGKALVAGCIGPTGSPGPEDGSLHPGHAMEVFHEQARALISAGVDLLVIETFTSAREAYAAFAACRKFPDVPLIVSLTLDDHGFTADGRKAGPAGQALRDRGAAVIGCNCGPDADVMASVVADLHADIGAPILAKPNAGIPGMSDGRLRYPVTPDDFVEQCRALIEAGAGYIGGCCGTSPTYITALHRALSESS